MHAYAKLKRLGWLAPEDAFQDQVNYWPHHLEVLELAAKNVWSGDLAAAAKASRAVKIWKPPEASSDSNLTIAKVVSSRPPLPPGMKLRSEASFARDPITATVLPPPEPDTKLPSEAASGDVIIAIGASQERRRGSPSLRRIAHGLTKAALVLVVGHLLIGSSTFRLLLERWSMGKKKDDEVEDDEDIEDNEDNQDNQEGAGNDADVDAGVD